MYGGGSSWVRGEGTTTSKLVSSAAKEMEEGCVHTVAIELRTCAHARASVVLDMGGRR